jgi:signal transduction histidine kinase
MSYSVSLIDKIIIFICCITNYLCQANFKVEVVTVLISIIFSSLLGYFDNNRIKTGLTIGFIFLSCFWPELIIFLPLITYNMLFNKYQYINLTAIIPLIIFYQTAPVQLISMAMVLLLLCILVKYRTETQAKLQTRYNELRDSAIEMSIQLKKQNSDLLEKQDTELSLATLNERNRIAREIHDNVGHLLSSAILQSGALLTISQDEKVKGHLSALNDTLRQAMNSVRTSVHELYDESIDLNAKIRELLGQFTFCEVFYEYHINSNPDRRLKYAFISIVKEALSNLIKHSNATHASIIFREHPALYQLIIRDNGTVKNYSIDNGLGLKNMMDRVHSFGGNINIMTKNGFEIFISIPKEASKLESIDCGR